MFVNLEYVPFITDFPDTDYRPQWQSLKPIYFMRNTGPYWGRERSVQGVGGETRGEATAWETKA